MNRPAIQGLQLRLRWLLLATIVVAATFTAWLTQPQPQAQATQITTCSTAAQSITFTCWQNRYSAMVASQGAEAAMADFKASAGKVSYVNSNCHQIAHVIGRAAAKRYGSLTKTYKHGDNYCWSGYYHGAIETIAQEIGPQKILSQVNNVCTPLRKAKEYGFDHFNCVHGMGHGLLAVQDDNLFTALKSCDLFNGDWQQSSCYGGVFMENVMDAIHHPVTGSPYLKTDDPLYPCDAVNQKYEEQCYLMQTSHMLSIEGNDFSKVFALCATVAAPFDATCYQSLGRDASGQSGSTQAMTIEHCQLGPTVKARRNCYTGAVKDFMSFYHSDKQAYAMCAAIPEPDFAASCHSDGEVYYKIF
jgi:hypothetical protein